MPIVLNGTTGITTPNVSTDTSTLGPLTQALNLGSTGQIVFPATQNPSANANTLDDYEEGTFTPTFGGLTNCSSVTASNFKYTKIGKQVNIQGIINWTVTSSATLTYLTLTLPFNSDSASDGGCGTAISNINFALAGVYRASAVNSVVYVLFRADSGIVSGADSIHLSFSYLATS